MFKPKIDILFYTHKNLRTDDTAIRLYEKVVSYGEPFDLNKWSIDGGRWKKIRIPKSFEEIRKLIPDPEFDVISFVFVKEGDYFTELGISRRGYNGFNIYGRPADPDIITLTIERELLEKDITNQLLERLIQITKDMYSLLNPYYGYGHDGDDWSPLRKEYKDENIDLRLFNERIFSPYWMNFFGPELVHNLGGREKVLNAPAYKKELLEDGGILLLVEPSPLNPDLPSYRKKLKEIADYFGISM
jgi:hypothetical protein